MSDDLKPCPFCGWDAPYVRATGIETEVYCQNCTAVGPMVHSVGPDEDVDEVAIKMWNRRADAATVKAAVEMMATEHGWVRRERLEKAVNRIEQLERERNETEANETLCSNMAINYLERAEAAEAKLAKAVEALREIITRWDTPALTLEGVINRARAALAELEGKE